MSNEVEMDEHDVNILVNFTDLKSIIQPNLGRCLSCKKIGLDIRKVDLGGICTGIQLFCLTCDVTEQKQRRQMIYLNEKLEKNLGANRKQVVRQITNLNSKINKQRIVSKREMPLRTTNYIMKKCIIRMPYNLM